MYTFLVAFLVVVVLRDSLDPMRVELRERGMVLSIQRRIAFVPFECVRYCQWMESSKKLVVQLGAIQERCSIHPKDAELLTPVLARYVEVVDESGNLLFERREPDGCSTPAPDAGDRGRVAKPVFARFQFTLRTLLVAAAAAGAASGWYAVVRGQTARQRAVAAKLDTFKPTVSWSRRDLRRLDFSRSPVKPGDDDLRLLEELTGLRILNLSYTNVTDAGLVHLRHLKRLESLSLGNTRITDAGLVRLHGLKNLNLVYLTGTGATPQGIAELRKALPGTAVVY
jgi:hypothetical protein